MGLGAPGSFKGKNVGGAPPLVGKMKAEDIWQVIINHDIKGVAQCW